MGASIKAEQEFKKQYYSVYNYLLTHKEKLSKRNREETGIRYEWYTLQRWGAKYWEDFSKQKVFYREISDEMNACIVSDKIFTNNKAYIVTGKYLEYLVVLFNSKLFNLILLQNANNTGGKGGDFIDNILVPIPNKKVLAIIEKKVTQVINDKISDDTRKEMEAELDTMIYDLYELSQEERKYIESKVK